MFLAAAVLEGGWGEVRWALFGEVGFFRRSTLFCFVLFFLRSHRFEEGHLFLRTDQPRFSEFAQL